MSDNIPQLKQGDEIFLTITKLIPRAIQKRVGKVTKVGRRYAHLDNDYRIELGTNRVVNKEGLTIGQVWPSEQKYQDYVERDKKWRLLRQFILQQYNPPKNLHGEDLSFILNKLQLDELESSE